MLQTVKFLKLSITLFRGLAILVASLQIIMGCILLLFGGEPLLIGDIEVPARVVGIMNFMAAAIYFFSLWLMASLIQLLLDMQSRLGQGLGEGRS